MPWQEKGEDQKTLLGRKLLGLQFLAWYRQAQLGKSGRKLMDCIWSGSNIWLYITSSLSAAAVGGIIPTLGIKTVL